MFQAEVDQYVAGDEDDYASDLEMSCDDVTDGDVTGSAGIYDAGMWENAEDDDEAETTDAALNRWRQNKWINTF